MTGCVFKRKLKSGISWGYSFFAGRDEDGRRIQVFKSGFPTKGAADTACTEAITLHEASCGKVFREIGPRGQRSWSFMLGDSKGSGFNTPAAAEEALETERARRAALVAQQLEKT